MAPDTLFKSQQFLAPYQERGAQAERRRGENIAQSLAGLAAGMAKGRVDAEAEDFRRATLAREMGFREAQAARQAAMQDRQQDFREGSFDREMGLRERGADLAENRFALSERAAEMDAYFKQQDMEVRKILAAQGAALKAVKIQEAETKLRLLQQAEAAGQTQIQTRILAENQKAAEQQNAATRLALLQQADASGYQMDGSGNWVKSTTMDAPVDSIPPNPYPQYGSEVWHDGRGFVTWDSKANRTRRISAQEARFRRGERTRMIEERARQSLITELRTLDPYTETDRRNAILSQLRTLGVNVPKEASAPLPTSRAPSQPRQSAPVRQQDVDSAVNNLMRFTTQMKDMPDFQQRFATQVSRYARERGISPDLAAMALVRAMMRQGTTPGFQPATLRKKLDIK